MIHNSSLLYAVYINIIYATQYLALKDTTHLSLILRFL